MVLLLVHLCLCLVVFVCFVDLLIDGWWEGESEVVSVLVALSYSTPSRLGFNF